MKNTIRILAASICLITIFVLSGCESTQYTLSEEIIEATFAGAEELNSNSDLGMEYLGKFDLPEIFAENKSYSRPYILFPDSDVIGHYYPFPYGEEYKADNLYVTKITIRGRSHHLFGITVGNSYESASQILLDRGYEARGNIEIVNQNCAEFKKACITIRLYLETDNSTISKISILTYAEQ